MSNEVFVTADLHLGHKKLQELRNIDDDELIRRWNDVVRKRDVVYVLGDVFRLDRLPELNGIKKLAMGNHDKYPVSRYVEHFSQVRACFEWDNCLLTHIPVHPGQARRYRLNVHGHTHEHVIMHTVPPTRALTPDPFYRCASLEQWSYYPARLREVAR